MEDESHALLVCTAQDKLQSLREAFLRDIIDVVGGYEGKWSQDRPDDFLKWLLSTRKISLRLAKFVAEILAVYDSYTRYIPATLYVPAAH